MEVFNLQELKARRAAKFYSKHREILNHNRKAEYVMYLGGIMDMERVLKATRIDTVSGYRYCQKKFMALCAKHFGTTVTDLKKEFNKSLTNN
jgi:hypothetical protein